MHSSQGFLCFSFIWQLRHTCQNSVYKSLSWEENNIAVQPPPLADLWMDEAKRRDDAVNSALPWGTIYLGSYVPGRQLYCVKCERMQAHSGVQNAHLSTCGVTCKHQYQINIVPFALCSILWGDVAACGLPAVTCWSQTLLFWSGFFFFLLQISPISPMGDVLQSGLAKA